MGWGFREGCGVPVGEPACACPSAPGGGQQGPGRAGRARGALCVLLSTVLTPGPVLRSLSGDRLDARGGAVGTRLLSVQGTRRPTSSRPPTLPPGGAGCRSRVSPPPPTTPWSQTRGPEQPWAIQLAPPGQGSAPGVPEEGGALKVGPPRRTRTPGGSRRRAGAGRGGPRRGRGRGGGGAAPRGAAPPAGYPHREG